KNAHSHEGDAERKTTWESAANRRDKRPDRRAGKDDAYMRSGTSRGDTRGERRQGRSTERRWEERDSRRKTDRPARGGNRRDNYRDNRRGSGRHWEEREGERRSWRDERRGDRRDNRDNKRNWHEDKGEYRNSRRSWRDDNREDNHQDRRDNRWHNRDEESRRRAERDEHKRPRDPQIPEFVSAKDLDGDARAHLRSLTKDNAERVARHLVYAGSMMDENPELAFEHAQAAYRHAARIDIVREALGLTSYLTGRYSQALRELRTYRRMTDDYSHVAIEADSERGLGRAEKALRFIDEIPLKKLDNESRIELALVKSGARADIGDSAGGLEVIERINVDKLDTLLRARIELIRADRYEELGRDVEANALREKWEPIFIENGEVDFYEDDNES
ncbi:MAG: hypothetical protein IKZ87_05070, partial [Actinomycetaceae bacterium]|nr:hypothetical protein [Actinomycetaceae bacterium]